MIITLLEQSIASVGYKFTHLGGTKVCNNCSLNKVCVDSLLKNTSYVVKVVRKKEHSCLIDNQIMVICEVEEATNIMSVENQKFLENIVLNRIPIKCNEILCENYEYCIHPNYNKESRIKVIKKIKKIECPLNYNLILVEAIKVED